MRNTLLVWLPAVLLILAGSAACGFFSMTAGIIMLCCGSAVCILFAVQAAVRRRRVIRFAEDIEHFLHVSGREPIIESYTEGAERVLEHAVIKMARNFTEQNSALRSDHDYLRSSLENLSHQLRTPLASLSLLTELLRKPDLPEQRRRTYLQDISALQQRMQWEIDMLLKIASLDAGTVHFQKEPVQAAALFAAACEPVSVTAELKGITLQTEISGSPVFSGDFQHSAEALINILKNCIEHTPDGGTIKLSAYQTPVAVCMQVTDTGSGIAACDLPHVFERFYRSSGSANSGYGIGLAYAKEIIERQGGIIEAGNTDPHGACFSIRMYHATV